VQTRVGRDGVALVALAALAAFASGAGGVDEVLLPGERFASILDSGGTKVVAIAGVEGSKLDVTVAASAGSRVQPMLTLYGPDGTAEDIGNPNPQHTGRAIVKAHRLGATGVWRLAVQTPAEHGGKFQLLSHARVPTSFRWSGTVDGAAPADHDVPAAPGGTLSVSVAAKGLPAFAPSFDVISPSGEVVGHATGTKRSAKVARVPLPEAGRYTVRISGGPGAFTAAAVVKPARTRKRTFKDVESRPDFTGFSPAETTNQQLLALSVDGVGFAQGQVVTIGQGTQSTVTGPVSPVFRTHAQATIDLSSLPPGTYPVRVSTPGGNGVDAPYPIVVTNRPPLVGSASQDEFSNQKTFTFDVRGEGFDDAAQLFLRHPTAGELPFTLDSRKGHSTITATITPPAYLTGPCDIEVRDPDGASGTRVGGLDLIGYRAPPVAVRTHTGGGNENFWVQGAAYDQVHDRVLLAVHTSDTVASFVLVDAATFAVVDALDLKTQDLGAGASRFFNLTVSCDPVGGTFAICACNAGTPGYGLVRIVRTTDIRTTLRDFPMAPVGTSQVSWVQAAPNEDDGGYVVVWDEYRPSVGSVIRSQAFTAAGNVAPSPTNDLVTDQYGLVYTPTALYQGAGRFVMAWAGYTENYYYGAVYTIVLDATGAQAAGTPSRVTSDDTWTYTEYPSLARNPEDGSMLLAFTYSSGSIYGSVFQRLQPVTAGHDPFFPHFEGDSSTSSYAGTVVWNPSRKEYVVTYVVFPNDRVIVRRTDSSGHVKPAYVLESYEGFGGVLYAGTGPDTLGLVRTSDGVADDVYQPNSVEVQVIAGRLR
jgi:hypothetical protein